MEKQDQKDIARHLQQVKEFEMRDVSGDIFIEPVIYLRQDFHVYIPFAQILDKKKRLQRFFKEAIEEKKRFELRMKHDEELEDRALETYRKAKERIQKIRKTTAMKEKEERARRTQIISKINFSLKRIHFFS